MFDNQDFYPCPRAIAHKMLTRISKDAVNFLEPSAGKGDIAEVIRGEAYDGYGQGGRYGRHFGNRKVDCIEQDPDLIATLLGKSLPVIGYDFLTYEGVCFYDAILANPPFSNGDAHLLRAWDFMHDGEIVCLLNEETIKNPYTAARKRLIEIIAKHGDVEYLGDCFTTAQRKTGVNVAMVYLKKQSDDDRIEMWANVNEERAPDDAIAADPCMLAIRDNLGNMQHYYDAANDHMLKAFAHIRKASLYMEANNISGDTDAFKNIMGLALRNVNSARAEFSRKHRHDAWVNVFNQMQFDKWLDKKQREEFLRDIELNQNIPFTKENIKGTLQNVFLQRNKLFDMSVANVFDELTRYFKGNTNYTEGWKSNDNFKVNEKLVFPYGCRHEKNFGFNLWYGSSSMIDLYSDLDRILCVLDGEKYEECLTIHKGLDYAFDALRTRDQKRILPAVLENAFKGRAISRYFDIRFFKKGTVHLKWKRRDLWEKFNHTAASGKKWIGANTRDAA